MWTIRIVAVLFGLLAASGAGAATVAAERVNCRTAARVSAPVATLLRRGDVVAELENAGEWRRVRPHGRDACWVRSDLLADGVTASSWSTTGSYGHAKARRSRASSLYSAPARYRSTRVSRSSRRTTPGYAYGSGSCPCGGSNVCVGPRGGRYCITSGGNKRYGL